MPPTQDRTLPRLIRALSAEHINPFQNEHLPLLQILPMLAKEVLRAADPKDPQDKAFIGLRFPPRPDVPGGTNDLEGDIEAILSPTVPMLGHGPFELLSRGEGVFKHENWADPIDLIEDYWNRHSAEEAAAIKRIADVLPPMHAACRLSICVPVAAHEEEDHILTALNAFAAQSAQRDTFEIVLFLNLPRADEGGPVADRTPDLVAGFIEANPQVTVHAIFAEVPEPLATIGFIRKLLTDAVLMRYYQRRRGADYPDHILVRADADTVGAKTCYVENFLRQFDKNPDVLSLTGPLDWDWRDYLRNPLVFFGTRLFMACDSYMRAYCNSVPTGGANFAVRAGVYAAVDGYSRFDRVGEDCELGWKIRKLKAPERIGEAIGQAGSRARLWSSARRSEAAVQAGVAPSLQWHDGSPVQFDVCNASIRKRAAASPSSDWRELAEECHVPVLEKLIEDTVAGYAREDQGLRDALIQRVVREHFSIECRFAKGHLHISDTQRFVRKMVAFREKALEYWTGTLGFRGAD